MEKKEKKEKKKGDQTSDDSVHNKSVTRTNVKCGEQCKIPPLLIGKAYWRSFQESVDRDVRL